MVAALVEAAEVAAAPDLEENAILENAGDPNVTEDPNAAKTRVAVGLQRGSER